MAEEIAIGSTGEVAKVRSPVAVVLLTLVTLGIYGLVWYYKINKEMVAMGRDRGVPELGDNPVTSLLAVTLGALILVPAIISIINTFKRVQTAQRLNGEEPLNGWIGILLGLLLGPVLYAYMQSGMNSAFKQVGPAGTSPAIAAG